MRNRHKPRGRHPYQRLSAVSLRTKRTAGRYADGMLRVGDEPVPRRRVGRPPLDPSGPAAKVTISLPTQKFDQYYREATAAGMTMSEFLRRRLARLATRPEPDR
jgi:hypothetical protein